MSNVRRFLYRFATLFSTGRAEADLAREVTAHLQLLEDQFVAKGMTRKDARDAARRTFGGVDQTKELQRDARSFRWLAGWPMDMKLGVRMLLKSPGLTIIGVIALAVAIGAGAMYLEFLQDLLHPSLPGEGGRIVGIRVMDVERSEAQTRALHDFAVWRGRVTTLEQLGAARGINHHLITGDGRMEPARAAEMSAAAFRLFPDAPLTGRTLVDDDELPGAAPVVVIGHDLWQTRFNSDPNIVGRTVRLGLVVHTIAGVMPEGFGFPTNQNLWAPLKVPAAGLRRGEGPEIQLFARLKPGASADAAGAELSAMIASSGPASARATAGTRPTRVEVRPYADSLMSANRDDRMVRAVLYAANLIFVMLLGICGANVATLVFARTATREAEITVRTALGASRGRICAQLFAEALVLSSIAALAGLAAARFGALWVRHLFTEALGDGQRMPFWWDDRLAPQTILYAFALAVLAALIVGVIPALKATGAQLQGRLREAGTGGSTMKFGRVWTGVIVAQAAITVMFLATVVSVGWATYLKHHGFDVTYPREQLLMARLVLEDSDAGPEGPRPAGADTLHAVADRLRSEPGVVSVTYATAVPGTTFEQFRMEFATPAVAADAKFDGRVLWSEGARVGVQFFETIGIPLVAGRFFTDAEILGGHHVAIVDETFVRLILGGRNPLGLMVREPVGEGTSTAGPWHEIVGVVKDVTVMPHKGTDDAMMYRPAAIDATSPVRLLVRTLGPASPIAYRLQAAALSVNSAVRLVNVASLDHIAEGDELHMRVLLRVFAVVSAVALLLSTAGIYALISFTLARRTREIGIRVALGAAPRRIIASTFSRAFTQFSTGILVGAVPSFVILGNGAEDAGGMGVAAGLGVALAVGAFVIGVAMISCAVPLRRALRIEPMEALRADG